MNNKDDPKRMTLDEAQARVEELDKKIWEILEFYHLTQAELIDAIFTRNRLRDRK